MNRIKGAGFWVSSGISMYMSSIGTTMFMTHTVDELLWGFKDPLLSRLKTIKPETEEYFGLMYNVSLKLIYCDMLRRNTHIRDDALPEFICTSSKVFHSVLVLMGFVKLTIKFPQVLFF